MLALLLWHPARTEFLRGKETLVAEKWWHSHTNGHTKSASLCPILKVVHVSALMCIRKKMNFKYPFPLEKISSLKLCN